MFLSVATTLIYIIILLLCPFLYNYLRSSIIRIARVFVSRLMITMNLVVVLAVFLFGQFSMTKANVVLIGNNVTLSFDDIEANFGEFLVFILIFNFGFFFSGFNFCLFAEKLWGRKGNWCLGY